MLKTMKNLILFTLLAVGLVSCGESSHETAFDENQTKFKNPEDVIREIPPLAVVDFTTFDIGFFGCERVESNRVWDIFGDSIYLTVTTMPDSAEVFELRGVEDMIIRSRHEVSARIKGTDGANLDLVDSEHAYTYWDTLHRENHRYHWSEAKFPETMEFLTNYPAMDSAINYIEADLGTNNWSSSKQAGNSYPVVPYFSRTFFEVFVTFNNGNKLRKIIILHYAN